MKVYKVLEKKGSALYSCNAPVMFCLSYAVGQETVPPYDCQGAHLIAFDSIYNARHFLNESCWAQFVIYLAEAEVVGPADTVARYWSMPSQIYKFWREEDVPRMAAPRGSVFCKSITLIKELVNERV